MFISITTIDPIRKDMSSLLSHTNMNKVNSLHHVKEHLKISNFLQFESHRSKTFKVRAISDLRDLYENKIQVPITHQEVQVHTLKLYKNTNLDRVF